VNRLDAEQQRLFGGSPDGHTRAMVLGLARPADWAVLRNVWQGVQAELELPAPAIAVDGSESYQLWFSLAQPISLAQAHDFLEQLRLRYLPEVAISRVQRLPSADPDCPDAVRSAPAVPAHQPLTGNWSAFVSPDLPAVFGEDPWLDTAPGLDQQADLLSRQKCISADAWNHALRCLRPAEPAARPQQALPVGLAPLEPRAFLHTVMNDPTAPLALRIEAAKALLSADTR
jgi:hypothetical protein